MLGLKLTVQFIGGVGVGVGVLVGVGVGVFVLVGVGVLVLVGVGVTQDKEELSEHLITPCILTWELTATFPPDTHLAFVMYGGISSQDGTTEAMLEFEELNVTSSTLHPPDTLGEDWKLTVLPTCAEADEGAKLSVQVHTGVGVGGGGVVGVGVGVTTVTVNRSFAVQSEYPPDPQSVPLGGLGDHSHHGLPEQLFPALT